LDEVVHRHINTDSDSELLLNVFAAKLQETNKRRINVEDITEALKGVYGLVEGAFACVSMVAGYGVIGFRDAHGIRPLVYGERLSENGMDYMFASENIALEARGFTNVKDVQPGQAVIVTKSMGTKPIVSQVVPPKAYAPCIFESRIEMGTSLGRRIREDLGGSNESVRQKIDVVIPVPDTSNPSALSTATELGAVYNDTHSGFLGVLNNTHLGTIYAFNHENSFGMGPFYDEISGPVIGYTRPLPQWLSGSSEIIKDCENPRESLMKYLESNENMARVAYSHATEDYSMDFPEFISHYDDIKKSYQMEDLENEHDNNYKELSKRKFNKYLDSIGATKFDKKFLKSNVTALMTAYATFQSSWYSLMSDKYATLSPLVSLTNILNANHPNFFL
ncbi:hypothetical protein FF38_05373, partial [Lucilia cuprina]